MSVCFLLSLESTRENPIENLNFSNILFRFLEAKEKYIIETLESNCKRDTISLPIFFYSNKVLQSRKRERGGEEERKVDTQAQNNRRNLLDCVIDCNASISDKTREFINVELIFLKYHSSSPENYSSPIISSIYLFVCSFTRSHIHSVSFFLSFFFEKCLNRIK